MIVKQALDKARQLLAAGGIQESAIEAEMLLRHVLKVDRVRLYLALDMELDTEYEDIFQAFLNRRLDGEPAAYLTGHREFYGLDFYVDASVLIPRPESELLVEKALDFARHQAAAVIADIGTGSGAIAISLAVNLPQARIYATDISTKALETARLNCRRHGLEDRIFFLGGDLLSPLPEPVDLVVANLPYVGEAQLSRVNTAGFEPALALNGGADGQAQIRRLSRQLGGKLRPGGCLLLEIGQGQGEDILAYLRRLFPHAEIEVTPDLRGIDRVVSLVLVSTPAVC